MDLSLKPLGAPVEVLSLRKSFGAVMAVDGVDLCVGSGEFIALLGPSGSGKTTILNMIAGFEYPSEGDILIDGRSVAALPANRRNLGMVFQRYALFPHMTVAQNIGFPLKMRGVRSSEIAVRVEELLATVKLAGYGSRRPGQLSGGQQQRVAFARAVAHRPPALLMDEPLAALDKKLREEMQLEVKQLQRQLGVTVIFVTHDQDEALVMADRIAVLRDGRIEQIGTPEELYERPETLFVADFLGETSFIGGRLHEVSGITGLVECGRCRFSGNIVDDRLRRGDPVVLGLRPERIAIVDQSASSSGRGLSGRIIESIYSGASVAHRVATLDGATVTVRTPAPSGAERRWQPGEEVNLMWDDSAARIYKRSA